VLPRLIRHIPGFLLCALMGAPVCAGQSISPAQAVPEGEAAAALPDSVRSDLQLAGVSAAGASFVVNPLDGGPLRLSLREDAPMNPASTMKLLTTYAGLAMLGPDFRWRTAVYASREPKAGRLDGDLIVRGDGDPSLVIERWWLLVQHVRALGIRDIRGDLVLDRSRYAPAVESGPILDHNDLRPYNVPPDALLVNFKALSLEFVPDAAADVARVVATPQLDGVTTPAQVPLGRGPCGDWKAQLKADFSAPKAPRFRGSYPASCGVKRWHVSQLGPDEYALASFRALWRQSGGNFRGSLRAGHAGADAVHLFDQESPPLAEVIRDINKNSNNVMARQLFLALGIAPAATAPAGDEEETAPHPAAPPLPAPQEDSAAAANGDAAMPPAEPGAQASPARSIAALRSWLERQGLAMPELVLQNGSGLSRLERISAASMARLLARAWSSADMPPFLASLPLAGVDGTMKHRKSAVHSAYVKTGYLAEVRALAGYVFAASGRRYLIVCFINDPHAEAAQAAIDDLLQWVWDRG
jgi:D-alanyl-D-alanine carboxypeptidase/D-alanyl-D-alanine-endopeptidase (penicillin-binding protein 4)